jgi:tetratricopeptide (TPR) repeat protein
MAARFPRFSGYVLVVAMAGLVIAGTVSAQMSRSTPPAPAQAAKQDDFDRQRALDLYHTGKYVEAMMLLEKVSADHPTDVAVKEGLAFSVMAYAATLNDPELRKKARVRARQLALEAKQLGDTGNLLEMLLGLPEDGSEPSFSGRKEVDDVMKAAEADFSRGDLDKARDGYLHALLLEPSNYEAILFMGDTYFRQHQPVSAGEWFARAVEINPNRETAFRYWGDSLSTEGKSAAAREKYIRAIIAEPYNKHSWVGLNQWAERTKLTLHWVRLEDKSGVSVQDDQHIKITLDPGSLKKHDPAGSAWLIYGMNRALWHGEKFQKEFPKEPKYRRTMREEADCLRVMVDVLIGRKDFNKHKKDLDPALLDLVQIDQAGWLEPFALLNRADNEIAQDYGPYRDAHLDVVYRYFDEFVVPKGPQ